MSQNVDNHGDLEDDWSAEYDLTIESIRENAPSEPGVYQILQEGEHPRYNRQTRVIKIGESQNLPSELENHLTRHTCRNRLIRILNSGQQITFRYRRTDAKDSREEQDRLLRVFEDRHWDLPVLSLQRGYLREQDRHYRDLG